LLSRWPETRLEPSLDRIRALCELLGDPQRSAPVIHLTGTNGKTSTARMVDNLLRALGLRTGRFTSPHVESMRERICVDGEPLSEEQFAELFAEVAPYADVVDRSGPHPVSFFEMVTAMAFAAFADAPVDVIILEVGMGGSWDATNVADAAVAVVTPIAVDHADYLGASPEAIAGEKAGILKPGSFGVLAEQQVEVAEVLLRRAVEVEATIAREGMEFGVVDRIAGVGGQMVTLQGLGGRYDELFVPLHGAHQAHNAVCAVAAVEALRGGEALDAEVVREAFGQVDSPGRLEVVRRSPTVLVDAAHNPHGAAAAAEAV
jgi:dihydrofolate synthase / folylpolyglutamate synthase